MKAEATKALALAAIAAAVWRPAAAADIHCPPHLGSVTIDGDVLIAAPCELDGTEVDGDVRLYAGGSLLARDVEIEGNLRGATAFEVEIVDSTVDGDIDLEELVGDHSVIAGTEVVGNIRVKDNRSFVQLLDNDVGSNVEVLDNRGGIDIFGNSVDGNLRCKGNEPAPTGGSNTVRGKTEDQCNRLVARSAPVDSNGGSTGSEPPASDASPGGSSPPPPVSGSPPEDTAGGPFNPVSEWTEGGGGGSVELLTLLALSLLARARGRERRRV